MNITPEITNKKPDIPKKIWVVVWSKTGARQYGIKENTLVTTEGIDGDDPIAVFKTKKEAAKYVDGNKDFKILKGLLNIIIFYE